ncbi:hypothetical protein Tco_0817398 [Tanacetum coccineum]
MSAKGPASGVDVTRTVVVMIGRKWDVNAVTSCYLTTDFVVSDAKNDIFMIEFDGATSIRKAFVKADGFVHYPFQLLDFDGIEPTDNKYLIDELGQSIRVTLWGALGDVLVEKKSKQASMYKLYLSRSSSTMIFDDADIPAVKALMTNMPASVEESKKFSVPVDHSTPREGTLENLLMWARNWKNDVCSELGSELTFLAGSELDLASYRLIEDYFQATCEQELCPFNFLLVICQVSSSELGSELTSLAGSELDLASYKLIEDYFLATCEQELCPFNFLLASCQVSSSEL